MKLLYTFFFFSVFSFALQAQIAKPLHPPTTQKTSASKNLTPIKHNLINIPKAKRNLLSSFRPQTLPALTRSLDKASGLQIVQKSKEGRPIMIKGKLKNTPAGRSLSLQTYDYLKAIKKNIQVHHPQKEFVLIEQKTDDLGQVHFKMQQYYKDLKVYGGQIWLHAEKNQIHLFNGRNYPTPNLETSINFQEAAALKIATDAVQKHTKIKALSSLEKKMIGELKKPELVVYHPIGKKEATIAWHLHLYPNISNQWEYFVDAKTGEILDHYKTLCQLHFRPKGTEKTSCNHAHNPAVEEHIPLATSPAQPQEGPASTIARDLNNFNRTVHSYELGGTYFLIDASRSMFSSTRSNLPNDPVGAIWTINAQNTAPQNDDFDAIHLTNNSNNWNDALPVSAHYNAGVAYNYFLNTFNRNSINGKGGSIISLVNVADEDGSSLENAFWSGQAMFYGNGGNAFSPLAGSLDVAGHEMSHGVIQNTANLRYQGESGALNESFADVFGVLIDSDDWRLGEDVVNSNVFRSGALRDMQNPHNGGSRLGDPGWQPAHVSEMYHGQQDNGGVHINSGIVNRAFYLIANNIGRAKAAQIYYRALDNYLVATSQFVDLRASILQSATDLHGQNSNEVAIAAQAFDQVGILGSNTGGGNNSGGEPAPEVEANPGNDFIIFTDEAKSSLYVADGNGKVISSPFTTTGILSKPSITDDGSAIVFVADDKTIHLITIDWDNGGQASEEVIQDQPIWRNVAVSRDGYRIAALQEEQTNQIEVFDFTLEEWKTFELYNPTFTEGISTGEVEYADVIEFDFSGELVLYDAFNTIKGDFGSNDISYWDIGFLKVYDNAIDNYEQNVNNNIFKLFSGIPENISIGNPTFSKNSPDIIAYESIDQFDQTEDNQQIYELKGVNISNGNENTIFRSLMLHVPSYARLDDKIIFNAAIDNKIGIAEIGVNADKISADGDAFALVQQNQGAQLGVWFSDGSRQLTAINELEKSVTDLSIAPNPFQDQLQISFTLEIAKALNIELHNTLGQLQQSQAVKGKNGWNQFSVETAQLPKGAYIISIKSENGFISRKIVK